MADSWSLLHDALEALYQRFSAYPVPSVDSFCTHCHSDESRGAFVATPLRELAARPLLWETHDHWPNVEAYKHYLPRLIEIMGPPDFESPLYPKHLAETLAAQGFASWPSDERSAVLRALESILFVGQTEALNQVFNALLVCGELSLESHCKSEPRPPPWASAHGFAHLEWLAPNGSLITDPPLEDQSYTVRVSAPFRAVPGEAFSLLWFPPLVTLNGWEPEYAAKLGEVRQVVCVMTAEIDRAALGVHETARLRVHVLECRDPFVVGAAKPASLDGFLTGGSCSVVRAGDRAVIARSLQGDINFTYYFRGDTLVLVTDTSICQNFFYSGQVALTAALHNQLALP